MALTGSAGGRRGHGVTAASNAAAPATHAEQRTHFHDLHAAIGEAGARTALGVTPGQRHTSSFHRAAPKRTAPSSRCTAAMRVALLGKTAAP